MLRPFRALRYDPALAPDLGAVICPPYDVISPAERERLLARHPYNAVRVELPVPSGAQDGGYDRAAETLRTWRHEGVLRRDDSPALYVYEQRYRLGENEPRTQRGVFARLGLEPLGQGVRPHERTFSGPREDRLRLLRATATNTSPIVVLAEAAGRLAGRLADAALRAPDANATDDAGIEHRLWVVGEAHATSIFAAIGDGPLTIADGHHRYETALRYRDEADGRGGAETVRPEDFVLALVLDAQSGDGPTILPTHRLVMGDGVFGRLWGPATEVGTVTPLTVDEAARAFSPPFPATTGRVALLSSDSAWLIERDRSREAGLFDEATPEVVRSLDVAFVEALLRRAAATDVRYTHEAAEARDAVHSGVASAAFLLAPSPLESVIAVAAAGAVMPQKSTYFHPKAATGLVMNPLE